MLEVNGEKQGDLLEALKVTAHLKSINKSAIVADETFVGIGAKVEKLIPGVEIAQYPLEEMEAAREWIRE